MRVPVWGCPSGRCETTAIVPRGTCGCTEPTVVTCTTMVSSPPPSLASRRETTSPVCWTWMLGHWHSARMDRWVFLDTFQYEDRVSYCEDKTVVKPSYLYDGNSYSGEMAPWFSAGEQGYRLVSNIRCTSNIRRTPTLGNSQLEFSPTISLAKTSNTRRTPSFDF